MNLEKYLQLGTIVLLKDAKKRVMIIGYEATTEENGGTSYDYMGCLYPEGVIDVNTHLLFNHDQIEEVYFCGYSDIEDQEFKTGLKELVKERDKQKELSNNEPRPFFEESNTSGIL